jgi:hypothetical protein
VCCLEKARDPFLRCKSIFAYCKFISRAWPFFVVNDGKLNCTCICVAMLVYVAVTHPLPLHFAQLLHPSNQDLFSKVGGERFEPLLPGYGITLFQLGIQPPGPHEIWIHLKDTGAFAGPFPIH